MNGLLLDLLMVYGIGVIGYGAKKRGVLGKESDGVLAAVVLHITLPALIIYSMNRPFRPEYITEFSLLILLSVFILGAACAVALFLAKVLPLSDSQTGVFQGITIFGNQGFIGYTVCFLLFGEKGIMYCAVFNLPYLLLIWTYGIFIIARRKGTRPAWRTVFLNTGVMATVLGLALHLLPFSIPPRLAGMLEMVGMPTIPFSMLLIGSLIANLDRSAIQKLGLHPSIWSAVLFKLLVLPLLLLPFSLTVSYTLIAVAVLTTATPSAPTVSMYAQQYGGDVDFASIGVFISTALSLLTIPLLFYTIGLLYGV
ncbi:AEC family transporter [Bacillus marinisedimentorum]|uniref:AEC family transporter n=1 Tax=Bacillus marinisedimentorum TaxID=1821260 RepID=UPI0007E155D0|nr:AEC family transporter [Bacillus marinisedimentorum]